MATSFKQVGVRSKAILASSWTPPGQPWRVLCSRRKRCAMEWQRLDDFEGLQYERVLTPALLEDGRVVQAFVYQVGPQER